MEKHCILVGRANRKMYFSLLLMHISLCAKLVQYINVNNVHVCFSVFLGHAIAFVHVWYLQQVCVCVCARVS